MKLFQRYKAKRGGSGSSGSSGWLYWMLSLGLLGGVGWVYWQLSPSNPPPAPAPVRPAPARPVARNQRPAAVPRAAQPAVAPPAPTLPPLPPLPEAAGSPAPAAPVAPAISNSVAPSNQVRVTPLPPLAPPVLQKTQAVAGAKGRVIRPAVEIQIALARQAICSGSIDGVMGSQTRSAIRAFQRREKLPETGEADSELWERLGPVGPLYTGYTVTEADVERLEPLSGTWLGKSQQQALEYETILELVSEKGHAHPGFVRKLNPSLDWTHVGAGTVIQIPKVEYPPPRAKADLIRIRLGEKTLEAFADETNLLAHFACSIAAKVEKRPVGELHVAVVAPHPNYTFDPAVFPESAEARELGRKLILPPGPNNPVGMAWIGLDRPGYGIHGTPRPEEVGRTESHGCFRLANWNAEYLVRLVTIGTRVVVAP